MEVVGATSSLGTILTNGFRVASNSVSSNWTGVGTELAVSGNDGYYYTVNRPGMTYGNNIFNHGSIISGTTALPTGGSSTWSQGIYTTGSLMGGQGYFNATSITFPFTSGITLMLATNSGAGFIETYTGTTGQPLSINPIGGTPPVLINTQTNNSNGALQIKNTTAQLALEYNNIYYAQFTVGSGGSLGLSGLTGLTVNSGAIPTGTTTDSVLVETTASNVATIKKVAQSSITGSSTSGRFLPSGAVLSGSATLISMDSAMYISSGNIYEVKGSLVFQVSSSSPGAFGFTVNFPVTSPDMTTQTNACVGNAIAQTSITPTASPGWVTGYNSTNAYIVIGSTTGYTASTSYLLTYSYTYVVQ